MGYFLYFEPVLHIPTAHSILLCLKGWGGRVPVIDTCSCKVTLRFSIHWCTLVFYFCSFPLHWRSTCWQGFWRLVCWRHWLLCPCRNSGCHVLTVSALLCCTSSFLLWHCLRNLTSSQRTLTDLYREMFKHLTGLYHLVNLRNPYFLKNEILKAVMISSYYCLEKSLPS